MAAGQKYQCHFASADPKKAPWSSLLEYICTYISNERIESNHYLIHSLIFLAKSGMLEGRATSVAGIEVESLGVFCVLIDVVTCSSSRKNSQPWTALAAESTRMLAMYGLAKNLLSSLSGRCLCHLSANGSSQFTPPKKSHIGSSSQRLTKWQSSEPFSHAHSDMPGLLQAIDAQDRIGWLAFFEGCIAVEWAGVQEAHFIWLG